MRETHRGTSFIELYRGDDGKLYDQSHDEEFPSLEGLERITLDTYAIVVVEYRVYSTYERKTFDPPYPGGWDHEFVLERAFLRLKDDRGETVVKLSQATQDAIWGLVEGELT